MRQGGTDPLTKITRTSLATVFVQLICQKERPRCDKLTTLLRPAALGPTSPDGEFPEQSRNLVYLMVTPTKLRRPYIRAANPLL